MGRSGPRGLARGVKSRGAHQGEGHVGAEALVMAEVDPLLRALAEQADHPLAVTAEGLRK
jgi:hypothetical protein